MASVNRPLHLRVLLIKTDTPTIGSMTSDAYTDVVGRIQPTWPATYNGHITKGCRHCGAAPGELCTYHPESKETRRRPCVARMSS